MSSSGNSDEDDKPLRPAAHPVAIPSKSGSGGGAGGGVDTPCNIIERTKINSPDATVAATLRPNDVLRLAYEAGPPKRLLVKTARDLTLGAITSQSMPQLIQCLISGVQYDVVVLSIAGGLIDVQVQPT
ncbi:hypothetical protein [Bosea sp. OK403]|uniref:hypothetical protein n=1 Tax=Bosea sp. OK403 TaxID=1855286 RepID=UPI0011143878|nr:hypothetical protein [Bosea sp. OK403]